MAYGHRRVFQFVGRFGRRLLIAYCHVVVAVEQRAIQVLGHHEVLHVEVVAHEGHRSLLIQAYRLHAQHQVVAFLYEVLYLVPLDIILVGVQPLCVEGLAFECFFEVGIRMAVEDLHLVFKVEGVRFHAFASQVPHIAPFHAHVVVDEQLTCHTFEERWRSDGGIAEGIE